MTDDELRSEYAGHLRQARIMLSTRLDDALDEVLALLSDRLNDPNRADEAPITDEGKVEVGCELLRLALIDTFAERDITLTPTA